MKKVGFGVCDLDEILHNELFGYESKVEFLQYVLYPGHEFGALLDQAVCAPALWGRDSPG